MKTSHHGSPRSRRFGSSFAAALAFASLSLGLACDAEDADVPIEDRVQLVTEQELREHDAFVPATPERLEALGISEDDVAAVQSGIDDLAADGVVVEGLGCACMSNGCSVCCTTINSCHVACPSYLCN